MIDARSFVEALQARAGTRVRIELAEAWATFRAGVRGYTGATDARQTLAELLEQASTQGLLVLPRGASGWDRTAQPPLPRWVKLPQARPSAKAEQAGHRSVAWPPELAFVAGLLTCPLLDDYLAVKRFLAAGGRARTPVPMRERSLELFGDEKRLDALLETSAFSPGRLTLELLRCYPVAPPLVWERSPHASRGAPLLIIENLHTYDSFRRWNRDVGEYAAIAYGHGAEFRGTVRDVPRVLECTGATAVEYFGDLDREGLRIPQQADAVLTGQRSGIRLQPAAPYYEALLRHGHRSPTDDTEAIDQATLSWLPASLRPEVAALLKGKQRIAQEAIGLDYLSGTHRTQR